jgi:ABC-type dipeptide/oligopeptide/nickel transport system permease subunit
MNASIPTLNPALKTGLHPRAAAWRHFRQDPYGVTGLITVVFFLLVAIGAWSGLIGAEWSRVTETSFAAADATHWLGTNRLGQDILERAIYGTGTAFQAGLLVAVVSTVLGAVLGGLAGWFHHGIVDESVLWLKGVLDSIPFYLFVAAVAYAMSGNAWSMHIAMIATLWTGTGRLVRGEVIRLKQREFVESARAIGLPGLKILVRHVLPNTLHILLVQGALVFVTAIKAEVILSFLGLGIRDGVSWGLMLAESTQEVLSGHFSNFLTASFCLFALLMGFNLLVDTLQDAVDPRQNRS